jgi:hypothetical protein
MNNKLKPALIGGVIVGLLSAIPMVNYCCCIWAIGGGVVAGLIYIKDSPNPVPTGDGAIVGALAGVVGAIIYLIIGLPIALFVGAAEIEARLREAGVRELPMSGTALLVIGSLFAAVCLLVLATLGGLLAIPIFEKRKGGPLPPQPPETGGPGTYPA